MFVYDQTPAAREHRLTLAMCLALLGMGAVRPVTIAALFRRGLAWEVSADGLRLTEDGIKVRDALVAAAGGAEESPAEADSAEAVPDLDVIESGDIGSTPNGQTGTVLSLGLGGRSHQVQLADGDVITVTGADLSPPAEVRALPSLSRADEVSTDDVVTHQGKRRRVIGTWTDAGDIVLSTQSGTLTMPPGTPLRVEKAEQLALCG